MFDSESVQQQFRQPGQQERLEYVGGEGKETVEKDNPVDAEVCGAETETSSDPEKEGEKHKAPDDKIYVERQEKYSETEPAKAPEEVFDSETVQQHFQ